MSTLEIILLCLMGVGLTAYLIVSIYDLKHPERRKKRKEEKERKKAERNKHNGEEEY